MFAEKLSDLIVSITTKRAIRFERVMSKSRTANNNLEPVLDVNGRFHAPVDGYSWIDGEIYSGGSYLPFEDLGFSDEYYNPKDYNKLGYSNLMMPIEVYETLISYDRNNSFFQMKEKTKTWTYLGHEFCAFKIKTGQTLLKMLNEYKTQLEQELKSKKPDENKGFAPEGRAKVKGKVVETYSQFGAYGCELKMLVKLENNSTVYGTLPKSVDFNHRGDIEFVATFKHSKDNTHSYFKRPIVSKVGE